MQKSWKQNVGEIDTLIASLIPSTIDHISVSIYLSNVADKSISTRAFFFQNKMFKQTPKQGSQMHGPQAHLMCLYGPH